MRMINNVSKSSLKVKLLQATHKHTHPSGILLLTSFCSENVPHKILSFIVRNCKSYNSILAIYEGLSQLQPTKNGLAVN